MLKAKNLVREHWEQETCGTRYGPNGVPRLEWFRQIASTRYELEPYIHPFANFQQAHRKRIIEIGVGAGSDFLHWCQWAEHATGVDLTKAAIELTRERLELEGVSPNHYTLKQADAENLPFENDSFDIAYSWGVLHHTPDTDRAFREVIRVLRPGGILRAMVYHIPSWTALMLWGVHGLAKGRPGLGVRAALAQHLESPGTKAYTKNEGRELLARAGFEVLSATTRLGPGDLLLIKPGQRYKGAMAQIAFRLYPRALVKALGDRLGLYLLLEGSKPES